MLLKVMTAKGKLMTKTVVDSDDDDGNGSFTGVLDDRMKMMSVMKMITCGDKDKSDEDGLADEDDASDEDGAGDAVIYSRHSKVRSYVTSP